MEKLGGELCPMCKNKTLTLTEGQTEVPYFGKVFMFSMFCSSCNYKQSDVEAEEQKEPCKVTFTIENEKDLNTRIVKSSNATIKIPQLRMSVEPGAISEGYVSNVEGILERFEGIIKSQMESADEDEEEGDEIRKNGKNLLKKIRKVKFGDVPLKIIIEDPSGNSAIISQKAVVEKLKK